jgi:PPOX class probable FMN-dependent enzyme
MGSVPFGQVVGDIEALRGIIREPSRLARKKELAFLDRHAEALVARSPLVLVGTAGADGRCDVSPRGGPPGFVKVLDERRLAVPDLPGNNRVDTFTNLLANPQVGLLFVVPGLDETLRVNGRAWVVTDEDVLARCEVKGRRRAVAIGVEVRECYIHCAKAFRRGRVWEPAAWPDRSDLPTIGCMLADQLAEPELDEPALQAVLDHGYATTLY